MSRKLSPVLLSRIDRLSGCQGRWVVDCREIEGDYSYALRDLSDSWLFPTFNAAGEPVTRYWSPSEGYRYKLGSVEDAALYCAHTGWRSRLLFVSDYLREDCSWPGGYAPSAVYRSNARVFRDEFKTELERGADGDGPDIALDIRYVTAEMIETLEALESYPLISEDDHSELELEDQEEAWQNWAAGDWRRLVCAAIDAVLPEESPFDGDDLLNRIAGEDEKLRDLFEQCCDTANEYWEESDGGQWIRLENVAAAITLEDLREITGLPTLEDPETVAARERWADQQAWRSEAYPWPDGSTNPAR